MNIYHGFFDLKPGVGDLDFAENIARYMAYLKSQNLIEGWRLGRREPYGGEEKF